MANELAGKYGVQHNPNMLEGDVSLLTPQQKTALAVTGSRKDRITLPKVSIQSKPFVKTIKTVKDQ